MGGIHYISPPSISNILLFLLHLLSKMFCPLRAPGHICSTSLQNSRLRLYGSTSSNQFPDAANGFQIPPDEHRDFNQVIFQYMKRVKLFWDLCFVYKGKYKGNTKEIFKKIETCFSILIHFFKDKC